MRASDLGREKKEIRRRVLELRDAMPEDERRDRALLVRERFLLLPEVARAGVVMLFWSFGSEVATEGMIQALSDRGVVVALPAIEEGSVRARQYRPGDATTGTNFGAREPAGGAPVAPSDIDVVGTPGVAFDLAGGRVGYGGGFYDRFLPQVRADAVRVALCFDAQIVDEVPSGPSDVPVDAIVTESRLIRVHAAPREGGPASGT